MLEYSARYIKSARFKRFKRFIEAKRSIRSIQYNSNSFPWSYLKDELNNDSFRSNLIWATQPLNSIIRILILCTASVPLQKNAQKKTCFLETNSKRENNKRKSVSFFYDYYYGNMGCQVSNRKNTKFLKSGQKATSYVAKIWYT